MILVNVPWKFPDILFDTLFQPLQPPGVDRKEQNSSPNLPGPAGVEEEWILERQAPPSLAAYFFPEGPALKRVGVFVFDTELADQYPPGQSRGTDPVTAGPAKQSFNMLRRVVNIPRFPEDPLQLLLGHFGVFYCRMFRVVFIQV